MNRYQIAALTLPIVPGASQIIIPAGTFDAPNGSMRGQGPWVLNDQDGQKLADNLNAPGCVDVVVDYEHQTLLSAENGKPAPAAGWLQCGGFVWDSARGLVATLIRWTTDAAEHIQEGEYRYLSPVFSYDSAGVPVSLMSVGLTNVPALTQLQELAIAVNNRGRKMSLEQNGVTDATGGPLQGGATQMAATVAAASVAHPTSVNPPMTAAPVAPVPATPAQHPMIAALTNQVTMLGTDNARLRAELAALQNQLTESAKDSLITAALSAGKILPGMEPWAKSMSIEELSSFISQARPIAALTGMQTQGKAPQAAKDNSSALNPDEIAVCEQMRIDPKLFLATKANIGATYGSFK